MSIPSDVSFNLQDHLRDMEERLALAIQANREESAVAHKDLKKDIESYSASLIAHDQRIIAVESTLGSLKKVSYAVITGLVAVVVDIVRKQWLK